MALRKKIFIASDHAGVEMKSAIQKAITGWDWIDLGPVNGDRSVDYPDFAEMLSKRVASGEASRGVLICGSGIGMSIAANKVPGIRAAVVENPIAARLASEHNHANVLCLGSRFIAPQYGVEIVTVWLTTPFSEEPRHKIRVEKIGRLENQSGK